MKRSRDYYPPGGHDFVGTPEIRALAADNMARRELKYIEDVSIFRARVFAKLLGCNALSQHGLGWAVFRPGEYGRGGVVESVQTDFLITSIRPRRAHLPNIHIIRNELVANDFGSSGLLTHHFVVDYEGDALYHADIIPLGSGDTIASFGAVFHENDSENPDEKLSIFGGFHPDFCVTMTVDGTAATCASDITPLGRHTNTEDKIHALEVGNVMMDEIGSTPTVNAGRLS